MRKLLSLSISTVMLVWSGAAIAAPYPDQVRVEVVSLSDLNLSSTMGARTALGRLNTAADRVCANAANTRQLAAWTDYRTCRHQALDSSVARLNAPLVTARYYKKAPVQTEMFASR